MNRLHCCIKYILPLTIACGNISGSNVLASEYFFDPSLLETSKSGQTPVDLSLFSHENAQQPGTYSVDVFINNIKIKQQTIVFVTSNNKQLQPQFTVGQLRELGFKIDEYSFFTDTENSTQVDDWLKPSPVAWRYLILTIANSNWLYRKSHFIEMPEIMSILHAGTVAFPLFLVITILRVRRAITEMVSAANASI